MKARIQTRERTEENASVRFCWKILLGPKLLVYGSVARHVQALRSILREWLEEVEKHLIIVLASTFELLSGIDLGVKCIFINMIQPQLLS